MKKYFFFFSQLFFILYIFTDIINLEYNFPVQFIETDFLQGVDEYVEIIDPTNILKAYAQFAAGLSPLELYANLKVNVIYNTDSIKQGDSATIRIVINPEKTSKPVIYSNYGFCYGVGTKFKAFGPYGGPWLSGPGIGLDVNLNIESEGEPPMAGQEIYADDVVDFLNLIPDLEGAQSGSGKAIISDKGDTLLSKNRKEITAGDIIGLFDILSLRLSGGLKIENGRIGALVFSDDSILKTAQILHQWNIQNDTFFLKVFIDSFAQNGDEGYIAIEEPYYDVNLKRRMGLCLQSFGLTVASTYWIDNNIWENIGYKSLMVHRGVTSDNRKVIVPIRVTGQPVYRADWVVNKPTIFAEDYWGNSVKFIQSGVSTLIAIQFSNYGTSYSPACSVKVEIEDTILFTETPALDPYQQGISFITYTFKNPGEHLLKIDVNYNHTIEELNFSNNVYSEVLKVVPPEKLIGIAVLDTLGKKYTNVSCNVRTKEGVKQMTLNATDTLFYAKVPGDDTILVSIITDTLNTYYAFTSKSYLTAPLPIDGNRLNINLKVLSNVSGKVTDYNNNPISSALINLGPYSTSTDINGEFQINKVLPLSDSFRYSLLIKHPVYIDFNSSIGVPSNVNLFNNYFLEKIDTVPPFGTATFAGNVVFKGNQYYFAGNPKIKFTAHDNYSGMRSVKLKGQYDSGWTTHNFTNIGEDTLLYITRSFNLPDSNGLMKIFYKFVDLAYNESDSSQLEIYALTRGPVSTSSLEDSIVYSPSFTIIPICSDTLIPLSNVKINVMGREYVYKYNENKSYSLPLPNTSGIYTIKTSVSNCFGTYGPEYSVNVNFNNRGKITIKNNEEFCNIQNVILNIYPMAISVSMVDTFGGINYGGCPLAQLFIPNTNSIAGCEILFTSITDSFRVAIFTDSANQPKNELISAIINDSLLGWKYILFDSAITVNPSGKYYLVLYQNINSTYLPVMVETGDSMNYPEGCLLYKSDPNVWYITNMNMAFKIFTRPDSVHISNVSNMNPYSSYSYNNTIPWILDSAEGLKNVYAEYFYNNSTPGIISDGIILDKTPPLNFSFTINGGSSYTFDPLCSLLFTFTDNYSDTVELVENGTGVGYIKNNSIMYIPFTESIPCTKVFSYSVKDKAGNLSSIYSDSIDYAPNVFKVSAKFNNRTSMYLPNYYPTLYIEYPKSVYPDSMRYSENILDLGKWIPFQSVKQCTLKTGKKDHTLFIEVKNNYGQTTRTEVSASIDSTPPLPVLNLIDEGNNLGLKDNLTFYWNGVYQDNESRLDSALFSIYMHNETTPLLTQRVDPFAEKITIYYPYERYNSYDGELKLLNYAGLYSAPTRTDGLTFNIPPSEVILEEPINGENVGSSPIFVLHGVDDDPDSTLCFKIEVAEDSNFTNIIKVFDGKTNPSGWSRDRYKSNEQAKYYVSSFDSFNIGNTYYWRAICYDSISSTGYSHYGIFSVLYSSINPDFMINEKDSLFRIDINNINNSGKPIILTLTVPRSGNVSISITDILGRRIKNIIDQKLQRGGYKFKIDQYELPSGFYFLRVDYEKKIYNKKLLFIK